jgi:O-methyltransferase domain
LLSWILHDWEDALAVRIVHNCRQAMADAGAAARLLVIEHVLPPRVAADAAADPDAPPSESFLTVGLDLVMMLNLGGRERTEPEFRTLLAAGGFALRRVMPLLPDGASTAPDRPDHRQLLEAAPAAPAAPAA